MGSLIMHLYISEQIKNKYGFSNSFIAGALMPDIKKLNGEDRARTHYLVERKKDRVITRLPEVEAYIQESRKEQNKELRYGYIAHLIQDKIWFKDYMPLYGEVIGADSNNEDLFVYPKEKRKIVRTKDEFLGDLYGDYKIWNLWLKEEFGRIDTKEIKELINNAILLNETAKGKMEKYLDGEEVQGQIQFITNENMTTYFSKCIEEISKKIDEMMKI